MGVLTHLDPAPLWSYFEEICKIPRLSRNEGMIRRFLLDFARNNDLEAKEDETGNILIIRPSSKGMENRKTIVLQSHMDMVGEKNNDYPHDWHKDPIIPLIADGWVAAKGTTLGADDGIGIAAQMAILSDPDLRAGKIECLFTVDEETGMTGAINMQAGFFEGKILLNLDSEDEGILFIGCAGGMDTVSTIKYQSDPVPEGSVALVISLTGLRGGHSGDEIHKGFGNSVKLMTRILRELSQQYNAGIHHFDGGNLRNAIPREAFATVVIDNKNTNDVIKRISDYQLIYSDELGDIEKELKITAKIGDLPGSVMDRLTQEKLLEALTCCPHGVIAWSEDIEDLVETSSNLASIRFLEENVIKIVTTQRSSLDQSKKEAGRLVEECMLKAGASVVHSDGYPGWKPVLQSEILKITRESYVRLFGREPLVKAIHAGLECGLIHEKVNGIDMISFGPTIRGAHTPEEKIEITTARMFWDLLIDVIENIPEVNR